MRYKPYRFKAYPNEYYYIKTPANLAAVLTDMEAFFNEYLKDNQASSSGVAEATH